MWKDPIVEEVRNAGDKLVKEAGNNLHNFCEMLRKKEKKHLGRLVRRKPRSLLKSTGTGSQ